ncbi:hypothetical protein OIU74_015642 [Salix koriyanagi]|uniref:Uncharacterized protein n=1 Tax=Salix koriyanagi TaxID=2511006 RepID=A0A9Q0PMQ3_9ROSI|nr:hypothetical protein OIU74_015642 [Salix koriyanagi]
MKLFGAFGLPIPPCTCKCSAALSVSSFTFSPPGLLLSLLLFVVDCSLSHRLLSEIIISHCLPHHAFTRAPFYSRIRLLEDHRRGGLFSFPSFAVGDYHQPLPTPPRLHQSTVL